MISRSFSQASTAENQAEEYLQILYGKCRDDDGHVVVVDPCRYRQLAVHLPSEIRLAARRVASSPSCFVKVNLMDAEAMARRRAEREKREGKRCFVVGSTAEVRTIVSFHLDVDAGKSDKYHSRDRVLTALSLMPHPPSLIVNSNGPSGGFHVYWLLDQPHRIKDETDRERIKMLARRWQKHLAGLMRGSDETKAAPLDVTANLDRLLRPAGSRRDSGHVVTIFRHDAAARYSIEDLALPPTEQETQVAIKLGVERVTKRLFVGSASTDRPIERYIDGCGLTVADLLTEAGYTEMGGGDWLRPGSESGSRTLVEAQDRSAGRPGVCVFSGNDPKLSCQGKSSDVGAFHSIDKLFVEFRFSGDWRAAASWCRSEIDRSGRPVLLSGSLASLQEVSR